MPSHGRTDLTSTGHASWSDLATTDPDAAKNFYTGLFGWELDDRPIPDGGVYTMLIKDGKEAAALSHGRRGCRRPGTPT